MTKPAVFFDRDGVLNKSIIRDGRPFAPTALKDFHLVEGIHEQLGRLKKKGFLCILITNQPDISRGIINPQTLKEMHDRLNSVAKLDDIFVCEHDDSHGCDCRKPKPGMILKAAQKWSIDLPSSYLIGDRWRDIEAGKAVGCHSILIEKSYSDCRTADTVVGNLMNAVDAILADSQDSRA